MQKLFENFRKFLNENIDSDVLQKIIENIEAVLEIQIRNIYKSSIITESEGTPIKIQLIGSYTEKLMEMICERWGSSSECSSLKEMGYNVEIIPLEEQLDENYVLLTKELL